MAALPQLVDLSVSTVEQGIPLSDLSAFVEVTGLRYADIYEVVLPSRTLKHRKARKEPLSMDESDKLVRLARVFDHAVKVWSTTERAREWLGSPKRRFEGRTPIQMLRTEIGARMVQEFLGQIDDGMFA